MSGNQKQHNRKLSLATLQQNWIPQRFAYNGRQREGRKWWWVEQGELIKCKFYFAAVHFSCNKVKWTSYNKKVVKYTMIRRNWIRNAEYHIKYSWFQANIYLKTLQQLYGNHIHKNLKNNCHWLFLMNYYVFYNFLESFCLKEPKTNDAIL